MNIRTHQRINSTYCGTPLTVSDNYSEVELKTSSEMAVDEKGLIHGGFIFSLADYAAMIAVNDPNVVLGAANVKFLKPVRMNETVTAVATVTATTGRKKLVSVTVTKAAPDGVIVVFDGELTCFILEHHVLDASF